MANDNVVILLMGDELLGKVKAVADSRFEGNRSAAIRWMLNQATITPEVASELMRQERDDKA